MSRFGLLGMRVLGAAGQSLSAGSPLPRAVRTDTGTCVDLCSVASVPSDCAAGAESSRAESGGCDGCSSADAPPPDCQLCVRCLCGIGVPAVPIALAPPGPPQAHVAPVPVLPSSVDSEPGGPPPKASA